MNYTESLFISNLNAYVFRKTIKVKSTNAIICMGS